MKKRIAIDLVPIRVGEGGTGSGIWTYARELLHAMDRQDLRGLEILCLINAGQRPYLSGLRHLRLVEFHGGTKNILKRLFWVHVHLPLYCLLRRVAVLHKLATDTPWWCPAKRVTTIHDFYYEFLLENHPPASIRLYERLENIYFGFVTRSCFNKSNALIAVSEATRQEAISRCPQAEPRLHVIHHGSTNLPRLPDRSTIKSTTFQILCVAKFMEHKGQHLLIAMFEQLLERHPELRGKVELHLRGFHNDSGYFAKIQRLTASSAVAESIHLLRFDPSEEIEVIYRNADLVVLLSAYEGFGLPVLEAQACGVPVLCSDLKVLREVGGEGAEYISQTDTDAGVEALYRYISQPDYLLGMKKMAMSNIVRFSWPSAAQKTLNVYMSCV